MTSPVFLSRSDIPRIAVGFNPQNLYRHMARRVATVDGPGGFNLRYPAEGIEIPRSVGRRYATKFFFWCMKIRGLKSTAMRRMSLRDRVGWSLFGPSSRVRHSLRT